jgi:hypothetical protein
MTDTKVVPELLSSVRGRVYEPGTDGYERARVVSTACSTADQR